MSPGRILESAGSQFQEYRECMTHRLEKGQARPEECERLLSPEQLAYSLNRRNCVGMSLLEQRKNAFEVTGQYTGDGEIRKPPTTTSSPCW